MIGKANIGAVATNPSNGTVLATSGSLGPTPSGSANYRILIMLSSSVAATFDFQAIFGGSPVSHTYIMVPANSSFEFSTGEISFSVPDNITLSILNVGSITGTVQVNMYWAIETFN